MNTRFLFTLMYEQAVCLLFWCFRMKCTKTMYFPVSFRSFLAGYQGHPRTSWIAVANPLLVKVMPFHQANLDIQIQCLIRQCPQANLHKQIQCLLRQHHSSLQASRSFAAPVPPRHYYRLVRIMRHFSPAEVSSSCLLIQLSRCS